MFVKVNKSLNWKTDIVEFYVSGMIYFPRTLPPPQPTAPTRTTHPSEVAASCRPPTARVTVCRDTPCQMPACLITAGAACTGSQIWSLPQRHATINIQPTVPRDPRPTDSFLKVGDVRLEIFH